MDAATAALVLGLGPLCLIGFIVKVALSGTAPRDRAEILNAIAEIVHRLPPRPKR